jgi:hypothetical protein
LAFLKALHQAHRLMYERWGFGLHDVAWAFPEVGHNIIYRFQQDQLSGGRGFDLIGPDVDLGFRLVALAPEGELFEVGAFYWTDLAPDIVNSGREEQGSISV